MPSIKRSTLLRIIRRNGALRAENDALQIDNSELHRLVRKQEDLIADLGLELLKVKQ